MDEKEDVNKVPPPNPPPAGDKEEPTPGPSQDFGVSAQSNAGDKEKPTPGPSREGNKSDAAGSKGEKDKTRHRGTFVKKITEGTILVDDLEIRAVVPGRFPLLKGERDYTRVVYQNLMQVVDLLDKKFPVPVSHRQLQEELGLSKGVIFDVAWNLCKRGWAENVEGGTIRRRYTRMHKEVLLGRSIKNLIENMFGVVFEEPEGENLGGNSAHLVSETKDL